MLRKQSIGKAVKKVDKVLPKSPSKKKVVVTALAESMGLISKEKNKHSTTLSDVLIDTVKKFYLREDIACFMPGKQDVTIRDENGKQKEQKRILTMTIGEAFRQFKKEYPDTVIGKSKFTECRPPEVQLSSAMPRNVCNYIYHSNFMLYLIVSTITLMKCFHCTVKIL